MSAKHDTQTRPWQPTARATMLSVAAVTLSASLLAPLVLHRDATAAAQNTSTESAPLVRGLPDFTALVDAAGPAVVNIRTTAKLRGNRMNPEMDEDMQEFFRRFFGTPPGPRSGPRPGQGGGEEVPRGVGSGFITSTDGFILTNAHVVDGADEITVRLADKREFKARLIGADKRTDVAVLRIEATDLPIVRFGDVGKLKVGEWVIAIGSPFDFDNTVTAGIVSAKARDTGEMVPFIQTDVAVNPGNSGGPLINMRGEVIGINSQIYSRSGGYMGISFAIPIDEAARVAEQIRSHGRVVRGRIGVQIGEVSREVAESLGLGKTAGALVRSVEPGSPAEKAGIEAGDIITHFDGRTVDKWSDLPRLVGNTRPGHDSALKLLRRGKTETVSIRVAELETASADKPAPRSEADSDKPASARASGWGLSLSNLDEVARKELKLRSGVRIDSAQGTAQRAGLRDGDILISLDNVEVRDVTQVDAVLARHDANKPLAVLYRRGEWAQYAVIRPAGK